jgi:hypothetical protein
MHYALYLFALFSMTFCSAREASGTAYDSLNQVCKNDDNGCTQAGYHLNTQFTAHVPYAAVLCGSDWDQYKYHNVNVTFNGDTRLFQVWDCCSDDDCGGCCTRNANKNGGFLLDMSILALKRYGWEHENCDNWGIQKIDVEFFRTFDPAAEAKKYGVRDDC